MMKKVCAGITASLMLAATAWVGGTGFALADYGSDRVALCGGGDKCSIDIRGEAFSLTEGIDKATVDVVGKPRITSKLQMYTIVLDQIPGLFYSASTLGSPVTFTTSASGRATVMMPIPVLKAPLDAGSIIAVQLPGASAEMLQNQPIQAATPDGLPDFTHVRSARAASPSSDDVIDGLYAMRVTGGLTGDVYGTQLYVSGKWRDITDLSRKDNGRVGDNGRALVYSDVSGFADGGYQVRMFNRTRGIYDLTTTDFDHGYLTLRKSVYVTPGEHTSAGRKWRTTCEPYSATVRCRTEIWGTDVVYSKGKLVKNTGWHFNNLTYKPAQRKLWKGNPLATPGNHTINGRKWRTECDTPATGGNGCRSFITSTVVEAYRSGKGYKYRLVTKEVFNNIVMFISY